MTAKRFILDPCINHFIDTQPETCCEYNLDEVVDLLNEQHERIKELNQKNQQLEKEIFELKYDMDRLRINNKGLRIENEQLQNYKQFVFDLIDEKLKEYPYLTLTEKWDKDCKYYHSCRENHEKNVAYANRHMLLQELKKELEY